MRDQRLAFTTAADGSATVNGETGLNGKLYAVEYDYGNADTGADFTLTCEGYTSKPLLTITNAGVADAWWYPRDLVHAVSDGVALTGTSGGDRACPILAGVPKLVVAQGGNVKTGALVLHYED